MLELHLQLLIRYQNCAKMRKHILLILKCVLYYSRDENRSLRSELESKDDLIHEVQFRLSSMDELQRTIEELQKENEEIGNNIETLHVNMEDLTQENERIKAVKEDMEATIYMYEEDLEQAKQRIASLEKVMKDHGS